MRFTSETSSDGVRDQLFTLGEIPGVLWRPEGATGARPLILMGHGGGQHKKDVGSIGTAITAIGGVQVGMRNRQ